jgi:hypothetical protein
VAYENTCSTLLHGGEKKGREKGKEGEGGREEIREGNAGVV